MRGARRKKLYADFAERFGRGPNGMVIHDVKAEPGVIVYTPSEKRRLKKAYLSLRRG